ncbi:MAG: CBS domain-containing protein [Steroidobacteraceae bacterium]|jgi:acetoin utilization protein AcuB
MLLNKIMKTRLATVEMDDKLRVVKDIFDSMGFHHLLVVGDDKTLRGVVSDRDLLRALSPYVGTAAETTRDIASLNKRVHQIMSRQPITLKADGTVDDAIALLLDHRISCVPIVDDQFRPVGIVSWRDILRASAAK